MPSWRDITAPQAQGDLDGLVGVSIDFAQQQLATLDEFFPVAAAVRTDGEIEMMAGRPDPADEHPSSVEVIDTSLDALRSKRNNLRASAIAADAILTSPKRSDAIRAHAGHHRIWEPPDR